MWHLFNVLTEQDLHVMYTFPCKVKVCRKKMNIHSLNLLGNSARYHYLRSACIWNEAVSLSSCLLWFGKYATRVWVTVVLEILGKDIFVWNIFVENFFCSRRHMTIFCSLFFACAYIDSLRMDFESALLHTWLGRLLRDVGAADVKLLQCEQEWCNARDRYTAAV